MSPKDKKELARDHLGLASAEAEDGRLGPATTMLLHAVEAAIDALAEQRGIRTSPTHWRRGEIAAELYRAGVLPADESGLIRLLNEERKRFAYEGDEPDFGKDSFGEIYARVEAIVGAAESETA
jgi:hypothetical protein